MAAPGSELRAEASTEALRPYVSSVVLRHLAEKGRAPVRTVEGSLVFVDISGFTTLSERLARSGREGAEHLADAIDLCFGNLLGVAYAHGGSLLKLGGDSLLLLFGGDEHLQRACRAAVGMRRAQRAAARIDAGGARVNMRMSIGIHTGRIDLYVVGASHHELIVTGPAATEVVRMEAAADPGEIVVSPAVAAQLPPPCLEAGKGSRVLLLRAPPGPAGAPPEPVLDEEGIQLAACLSTALRAHVEHGVPGPEHRRVVVAFVYFDGTDELIARGGPLKAAGRLDTLVTAAQEAADEYDVCFLGSDVDADGGKLILTAGAPHATGEDEERMLLAVRRIIDAKHGVSVRAGVHRGAVFAGDVGPPYRRTYTVMGDAVNLAARLMAAATPGALYATGEVIDRSATKFAVTPLEPFMVKGKAKAVHAWSVGPVLAGRREWARSPDHVPLVGRERELGALEEALAQARAGRGGLIEIAGEPGIGKTRLVEELLDRAGDLRLLRTACEAYWAHTPYALWRTLLRQLLDVGPDDPGSEVLRALERHLESEDAGLARWLPLLAVALDIDAPPTPEVARLAPEFRSAKLREVLLRFLRPRLQMPTVVAVENVHYADAASRDVLRALADGLESSSWLVLLTRRDAADGVPGARVVNPGPLGATECLELAEALTEDEPVPPHVLRLAAERSGGNPQFLLDLLRAATDGATELPDSIEAAATARIDRLGPKDRAIVRRAAVLGVTFARDDLGALLDDPAAAMDPATWRRLAGLFEPTEDGRIQFRRAVVREAAYDGLPYKLRRQLHAVAGSRLESTFGPDGEEAADALSLHFMLAGDRARAFRYSRIAARRAAERAAHADAAMLLRRALDVARALDADPTELAECWEALGEAHHHSGEPELALRALDAVRRLREGDPIAQARILERQAQIEMHAGSVNRAVRKVCKGLRGLEGWDGREAVAARARLMSMLATVRQRQGRPSEAVELCHRAMADAEATDELNALARACFTLDWALVEGAQATEGRHSQRALAAYRRLGDRVQESIVLNNLGGFAMRAGRWDDAINLWKQSARASEQAGDDDGVAFATLNIGELLADQGRLEEAHSQLRRALQIFRGTRNEYGAATAHMLLGRTAVRMGRAGEGRQVILDACARFQRLGCEMDIALAEALLAEACVFDGDSGQALAIAERLMGEPQTPTRLSSLLQRVRAWALEQDGDTNGAVGALTAAIAEGRAHGDAYDIAAGLHALARTAGNSAQTERERDELLTRLGVVRPPPLPK